MTIAIVGGGLTGMSAAYELARRGVPCTIYEKDSALGGLAGSFRVDGTYLEKFYHHLFTSDVTMVSLIDRLGLGDRLEWLPTTNSYYANRFYRLSTPIDLLRFTRIPLVARIRLGLLYLRTRFVDDWRPLEEITAKEWLIDMAGQRVYDAVWEPMLRSKFGRYADQVAAVWIWNKLKLRGSSRGKTQEERLGYLQGGFGQAVDAFEQELRKMGVEIVLDTPVTGITVEGGGVRGIEMADGRAAYERVLVTTAPQILSSIAPDLPAAYRQRLDSIPYLANVCLVMRLDRSLSDTYWLNIGDPEIPFTGVIEHTNMQRPEIYGGAHLTYISRYLDPEDPLYRMSAEDVLESYLPHLQKMFRGFGRDWVEQVWAWRERYTQPVIGLRYSERKPPFKTPVEGLWLSCMAQVYPEDRGMNYAVLYGQKVVQEMMGETPARGERPMVSEVAETRA
jgi:protoporphyrinogen oxidase